MLKERTSSVKDASMQEICPPPDSIEIIRYHPDVTNENGFLSRSGHLLWDMYKPFVTRMQVDVNSYFLNCLDQELKVKFRFNPTFIVLYNNKQNIFMQLKPKGALATSLQSTHNTIHAYICIHRNTAIRAHRHKLTSTH